MKLRIAKKIMSDNGLSYSIAQYSAAAKRIGPGRLTDLLWNGKTKYVIDDI